MIISIMRVKAAESTLDDLKKARQEAKDIMEVAFAEAGVTSVKYQGCTVFAKEQVFASLVNHDPTPDDPEDATKKTKSMQALKDNDLGWMVKEGVAAQTLRGWVNEQEKDDGGNPKIPEALKPFIKVSKKTDIGMTRS